jgi:hypothetical protein
MSEGNSQEGGVRRRCGDCNLCCTVMAVPDLKPDPKGPGERCAHACSRGCRIYADRPQGCVDFDCVWLQGTVPRAYRPDKVGVVFAPEGSRMWGFVDPRRPDLWRQIRPWLEDVGRSGIPVLIGPAGGKPHTMFVHDGERRRPPDGDFPSEDYLAAMSRD